VAGGQQLTAGRGAGQVGCGGGRGREDGKAWLSTAEFCTARLMLLEDWFHLERGARGTNLLACGQDKASLEGIGTAFILGQAPIRIRRLQ
jgi:hypothetical protein